MNTIEVTSVENKAPLNDVSQEVIQEVQRYKNNLIFLAFHLKELHKPEDIIDAVLAIR